MQHIVPVKTEVGQINFRDTWFLRRTSIDHHNNVALRGLLVGRHCTQVRREQDFHFELTFEYVLGLKMTELDSWRGDIKSSFAEVRGSEWVKGLGGKVTPEFRHFVLLTYDDVFEVVSRGYRLVLQKIPTNPAPHRIAARRSRRAIRKPVAGRHR